MHQEQKASGLMSSAIAHGQLTELKRLVTNAAVRTRVQPKGHYQNLITLIDNALSNK